MKTNGAPKITAKTAWNRNTKTNGAPKRTAKTAWNRNTKTNGDNRERTQNVTENWCWKTIYLKVRRTTNQTTTSPIEKRANHKTDATSERKIGIKKIGIDSRKTSQSTSPNRKETQCHAARHKPRCTNGWSRQRERPCKFIRCRIRTVVRYYWYYIDATVLKQLQFGRKLDYGNVCQLWYWRWCFA